MSNWLTTGQMIDVVMNQVGTIAESADDVKAKWDFVEGMMCDYRGTGWEKWTFTSLDVTRKWRIRPKFVSLTEAMKALEDGYTIRCYPGDDDCYLEFNEADMVGSGWFDITWGRFIAGKWTIENNIN